MRDGKQLEALVAFIEKALLPEGFEVKTNERIFNGDGVQIAEFDIEMAHRGKRWRCRG
jgi:predicted RecB family endonuclease